MARSLPFWQKLALIAFGAMAGLVCLELSLRLYHALNTKKGTEFASFDDVRRAIVQSPDAPGEAAQQASEVHGEVERVNLRGLVNPHPDDHIVFELRPNLNIRFQRTQVRTNSCGMRGPERPLQKSAATTYRIAVLGDSFAFGWGVEQHETFAARLEDNLNRLAAGKVNFEVLNFGVPGYSTFQEVAKFKETGLAFNVDEVLLFFVQNDFGLPFYVRDVFNRGQVLAATEFVRLGRRLLNPQLEQQRLQLLGFDANSAIRELAALCRQHGLRLSIAFNPRKGWKKDRARLWALKKLKHVRVLALRGDFERLVKERNIPNAALTLSFDPHPSALRHAIYGDLLTPYFMDRLE